MSARALIKEGRRKVSARVLIKEGRKKKEKKKQTKKMWIIFRNKIVKKK